MRTPWMAWGSKTVLAISEQAVELLSASGREVRSHVRVAFEAEKTASLTEAIRQALAETSGKTTALAVSIPNQAVLFRSFSMPALPRAEWGTAVQFEARKYIPFKTEELIWTYHVVQSKISGMLDVVFAAVQPDTFHGIQEALAAAGVQPTLIEPRSLSLARLVGPSKASSSECVCVVEVAGETAHLAIVKGQRPYLTRSVNLAVKGEAAAPLPSSPSTVTEGAADVTDPRAQRLLSELSVSLDFFMREHPAASVSRVWLFGDESVLSGWCWWLAEQLHRPVDLGRSLVEQQVTGDVPLTFASAVGLLRADPQSAPLDFLRQHLKPGSLKAFAMPAAARVSTAFKQPQAMVLAGLAVSGLVLLWAVGAHQVGTARAQLAQLVQARQALGFGLTGKSQADLEPLQAQANAALALLRPIMDQRIDVTSKLDALARTLPDGIWITGLGFNSSIQSQGRSAISLTINGACYRGQLRDELVAIQAFGDHVRDNQYFFRGFKVARVEAINANQAGSYTYRIFQLHCDSNTGS